MRIKILASMAAFALLGGGAARATPILINLSAGPTSPNAGPASYQGYATPNPIVVTLAAGSYQVSVVGIPGGGTYNAFSINTGNNSYSDGWHYSINGGSDNAVVTGSNYATASLALSAYSALAPTVITLASSATLDFYLNDASYPYFGDDTGGVSLSLNAVPEPAAAGLFGLALTALLLVRHRRVRRASPAVAGRRRLPSR